MSARHNWTASRDATLRTLRVMGASWAEIASVLDCGLSTARERARRLGLEIKDRAERKYTQAGPAGLAAEVVQQAINDALAPVQESRWISARKPMPDEKAEAIAFCTAAAGPWAEAREVWCDNAGILPDAVRAHVLRRIEAARGA